MRVKYGPRWPVAEGGYIVSQDETGKEYGCTRHQGRLGEHARRGRRPPSWDQRIDSLSPVARLHLPERILAEFAHVPEAVDTAKAIIDSTVVDHDSLPLTFVGTFRRELKRQQAALDRIERALTN